VVATAILDRLLHHSQIITIRGDNEDVAAARAYVVRRTGLRVPPDGSTRPGASGSTGLSVARVAQRIVSRARAFLHSEMTHARSAEHVASLHGVDALSVKRLTKLIDHIAGYEPATAHDRLRIVRHRAMVVQQKTGRLIAAGLLELADGGVRFG
jgi:hypothetical protein